jgi:diacylglycerol kinase (ATP)
VNHFLRATRNTWKGLIACANSELAFRQELVVLAVALPLACFIATSVWRLVVLIAVLLLVLVVELLNTAIRETRRPHHAPVRPRRSAASRTWARPRSASRS